MRTDSQSFKTEIFVLGLHDAFRGESLVSQLESHGFSTNIVWGIDGRKESRKFTPTELSKSLFFQNRKISQTEIACTLGHRKMHEVASAQTSDLYVFLEDDVAIEDFDIFRDALNEIYGANNELLIWNLLFRPHNILNLSITKKFHLKFQKTYLIPTSTTGYVMNHKTLTHLIDVYRNHDSIGYLADFPVYFADSIGFMAATENILSLSDEESIVALERKLSRQETHRNLMKSVLLFSCVYWLIEGKKYSSLRAYLMHFHGRKLRHILDNFDLLAKYRFYSKS
jgi:hypothetical protein